MLVWGQVDHPAVGQVSQIRSQGGVCILQCRCRTFGCCDLVRLANTFSYELLVVTAKWAPLVRFVLGVPHQKTPENTLMSHTSLRPRYTFISAFVSGCTLVSRRHTTTTVTVQATTPSHPRSSASMPSISERNVFCWHSARLLSLVTLGSPTI